MLITLDGWKEVLIKYFKGLFSITFTSKSLGNEQNMKLSEGNVERSQLPNLRANDRVEWDDNSKLERIESMPFY